MIKNNIKEFFKNLPYIFVPMGIIYLFIIVFIFTFISNSIDEVINLINHVSIYTGEAININKESIINYLQEAFSTINFDQDFLSVAIEILNGDFLIKTLDGLLQELFIGYEGYSEQLSGSIIQTIANMKGHLIASGVFLGLSLPISYVLTSFLIKRNSVKKTIKQKLVSYLFDPLIILFTTLIAFVLFVLWRGSIFISIILFFILINYINLFEAYYIRKDNKIKFKNIVTFKNSTILTIGNIIVALITLLLIFLISKLTITLIGILLLLPTTIYLYIIISINAESYLKNIVEKKKVIHTK